MSILDDHDHVSGEKVRFSSDAASLHQVVAGVALQLFSPGIPCIYYGTEQSFAGPEKNLRDQSLPDYNRGSPPPDKYLRECMFGPEHPRGAGLAGVGAVPGALDSSLPGFGAFGTTGHHCFDQGSPAFLRIAALSRVRRSFPVLRHGRLYQRPISNFLQPFALPGAGELIAWSRLLDEDEAVIVVNGHGVDTRGGDVLVDADLNPIGAEFEVIANSAESAVSAFAGTHPVGERVRVDRRNGQAFLPLRSIGASEVLVLINVPPAPSPAPAPNP